MGSSRYRSVARDHLIYKGELFVGQDIYWHLGGVHGHDRHQWIVDELESGHRVAEKLSFEKWVGGPTRVLEYEQKMRVWLFEVGERYGVV